VRGPHSVRDGLLFFFLLFMLRVLLRNQWLGAAAFVVILTAPIALGDEQFYVGLLLGVFVYGLAALVVIRYGLLALTAGFCVSGLIGVPLSLHTGAWYFGNVIFLFLSALALVSWAFYTSMGGRGVRFGDSFA